MPRNHKLNFILVAITLLDVPGHPEPLTTSADLPLRFHIVLDAAVAPDIVSGRLFVMMADASVEARVLTFAPGFNNTAIAAMEVKRWLPGSTIELDPDLIAYPKPFSHFTSGKYQFMALLDQNHDMAYRGQGSGDLVGPVVQMANLDPRRSQPIGLRIDHTMGAQFVQKDTDFIKYVEIPSSLMSHFWGRPISMRAAVLLPPTFTRQRARRFPVVYAIHPFGADYTAAWSDGPNLLSAMRANRIRQVVYVYLDASVPTGHHAFVDSVNNGPWGKALVEELIPHIERRFDLSHHTRARFLTGHSSGGWSSLWLQINYPDFFSGAWATSPDPVDMRSFVGIDVTPSSRHNFYTTSGGLPRNLIRYQGHELLSVQQFVQAEMVLGGLGGQFTSFEWAWSPRDVDGRPKPLFDRESGEQDLEVQKAWRKFDIRRVLEEHWTMLQGKLRHKLHIWCGGDDNFHLEEATRLLCAFFASKGNAAECAIIPNRDHLNLYEPNPEYPNGLQELILRQIVDKFSN